MPGRLVAPEPLEPRAEIERRAVGPLGVLDRFDGLLLGQQLLEPADVPLDDRAMRISASVSSLGGGAISR